MLEARRKSLWCVNYVVLDHGRIRASLASKWPRGMKIVIDGQPFECTRELIAPERRGWNRTLRTSLIRDGQTLITVEFPLVSLTEIWHLTFSYEEHRYQINLGGSFTRCQVLQDDLSIGEIRHIGVMKPRVEIDLPSSVPIIAQIFLFYVFLGWK